MEGKIVKVEINKESVEKEFIIEIELKYYKFNQMIKDVSGVLIGEKSKELSLLVERKSIYTQNNSSLSSIGPDAQRNSNGDRNKVHKVIFRAPMSRIAIEYLENARIRNESKKVILVCKLHATVLKSSFNPNNILTPSNRYNINIFSEEIEEIVAQYTIDQTSWLESFSDYFQSGQYVLLELVPPNFENILNPSTENCSDNANNELYEIFQSCQGTLAKMKECIDKGEWKMSITHSRELIEAIKTGKNSSFQERLKERFVDKNGSEAGFDDFINSILKMFDYVSKFIHVRDKSGLTQNQPIAQKEDAYFNYSFCINLLNLMLSKL